MIPSVTYADAPKEFCLDNKPDAGFNTGPLNYQDSEGRCEMRRKRMCDGQEMMGAQRDGHLTVFPYDHRIGDLDVWFYSATYDGRALASQMGGAMNTATGDYRGVNLSETDVHRHWYCCQEKS